jgi:hypothetical protein
LVDECVQTESPPYRYVSVEGAATFSPADTELHARPMAHRALGVKGGDRYVESGAGDDDGESIRVSMVPERWFSVDHSKISAIARRRRGVGDPVCRRLRRRRLRSILGA